MNMEVEINPTTGKRAFRGDAIVAPESFAQSFIMNERWLWVGILAILLVEVASQLAGVLWGVLGYSLLLVGLIVAHAVAAHQPKIANLTLTVSCVPLVRLLTLTLSNLPVSREFTYFLIAVPMLVIAVMIAIKSKQPESAVSHRFSLTQISLLQFIAIAIGVVIGVFVYMLGSTGLIPTEALAQTQEGVLPLATAAIAVIIIGASEEIIFRYAIQGGTSAVLGRRSIIFVALLQIALLVASFNVYGIFIALSLALVYGAIVRASGSVVGVCLGHAFANVTAFLLSPIFGMDRMVIVALAAGGIALLASIAFIVLGVLSYRRESKKFRVNRELA